MRDTEDTPDHIEHDCNTIRDIVWQPSKKILVYHPCFLNIRFFKLKLLSELLSHT